MIIWPRVYSVLYFQDSLQLSVITFHDRLYLFIIFVYHSYLCHPSHCICVNCIVSFPLSMVSFKQICYIVLSNLILSHKYLLFYSVVTYSNHKWQNSLWWHMMFNFINAWLNFKQLLLNSRSCWCCLMLRLKIAPLVHFNASQLACEARSYTFWTTLYYIAIAAVKPAFCK